MAAAVPRYAPGLPLPRRPYRPGQRMPRPPALPIGPGTAGAVPPATPDALSAEERRCFLYGVDLYNADCWWEAHEAWEALWARAPRGSPLFHLLRGLIMLAAARLKHEGGRAAGRQRLLQRAADSLAEAQAVRSQPAPLGIEAAPLAAGCATWRTAAETDPARPPPAALRRLRLREG